MFFKIQQKNHIIISYFKLFYANTFRCINHKKWISCDILTKSRIWDIFSLKIYINNIPTSIFSPSVKVLTP